MYLRGVKRKRYWKARAKYKSAYGDYIVGIMRDMHYSSSFASYILSPEDGGLTDAQIAEQRKGCHYTKDAEKSLLKYKRKMKSLKAK